MFSKNGGFFSEQIRARNAEEYNKRMDLYNNIFEDVDALSMRLPNGAGSAGQMVRDCLAEVVSAIRIPTSLQAPVREIDSQEFATAMDKLLDVAGKQVAANTEKDGFLSVLLDRLHETAAKLLQKVAPDMLLADEVQRPVAVSIRAN